MTTPSPPNIEHQNSAHGNMYQSQQPTKNYGPFQWIPLEIFQRITDQLDTQSLCSLRLVSQSLERSLHSAFVAEYFTRKQFMLSKTSLQALIDISKSRLGPSMHHLLIGLEKIRGQWNRKALWNEPDNFNVSKARKDIYKTLQEEDTLWWNSESPHQMLVEALQNLPNLNTIVIRDHNSRSRWRDTNRDETSISPAPEWRSYGYRAIIEQASMDLTHEWQDSRSPDGLNYCSEVFVAMLRAITDADAKPKGIELLCNRNAFVSHSAFRDPILNQARLAPMLESLQRLHLTIDTLPLTDDSDETTIASNIALRDFFSKCKNLKDFRLNYRASLRYTLALGHEKIADDSFARWLASCDSTTLPKLDTLSIGKARITVEGLLGIISCFAESLKSLELWKVSLATSETSPQQTDDAENPVLWSKVLKGLLRMPHLQGLRHIKLGMLQQMPVQSTRRLRLDVHVGFTDRNGVSEYTGSDWRHAVEDFRAKLEVAAADEVASDSGSQHSSDNETDDPTEDDASDDDEEDESEDVI